MVIQNHVAHAYGGKQVFTIAINLHKGLKQIKYPSVECPSKILLKVYTFCAHKSDYNSGVWAPKKTITSDPYYGSS